MQSQSGEFQKWGLVITGVVIAGTAAATIIDQERRIDRLENESINLRTDLDAISAEHQSLREVLTKNNAALEEMKDVLTEINAKLPAVK